MSCTPWLHSCCGPWPATCSHNLWSACVMKSAFTCVQLHEHAAIQFNVSLAKNRVGPALTSASSHAVQGRNDDELPEVLLGGVRAFYWDLHNVAPFPAPEILKSGDGQRASGSSSSASDTFRESSGRIVSHKGSAAQLNVPADGTPAGDTSRAAEFEAEFGDWRSMKLPPLAAVPPTSRRVTSQSSGGASFYSAYSQGGS